MQLKLWFSHWRKSFDVYLCIILLLTAVVLFFRLSHGDMASDDAHYSARSIGLVDFMFATRQTTPLVWYDHFPWWAYLSFHDHPPVLFLIQHFFLSIHDSFFWARVPYALMALGTIILTYCWTKFYFNSIIVARVAAAALALNAHFIWFGRSALMESGVLFFIVLAWYYFIRFIKDEAYFWKYGLALGLVLEVKFTAFFVLPAMLLYLIISRRDVLLNRKLYFALSIAFVLFLPVVIYNMMMYQSTGHFALQFARLLHQSSPWNLSGATFSPLQGIGSSMLGLARSMSWPYFFIAVASVIYVVISRKERWILVSPIIFLLLEDATIGSKELYSIFLAPAVGVALVDGYQYMQNKFSLRPVVLYIVGSIVVLYLSLFVVNSNWNPFTFGSVGWIRSEVSFQNSGMWQLDQFLDKLIKSDPSITRSDLFGPLKVKREGLKKYRAVLSENQQQVYSSHRSIILFDSNVSWFARVWLVERRRFYENIGFILSNEDFFTSPLQLSSFYFIKATEYAPLDPEPFWSEDTKKIEENITENGIPPELIYRDDGKVAFKVYHLVAIP